MIERIGPKNPTRLYVREWIEKLEPTLTNERLAERMDIAPGTLSKLLNGNMTMTVPYLAAFAHALDIEDPGQFFHDPKRPTMDELLRGLPQQEEQRIIRYVELLVNDIRSKTGTEG